MLKKLIRTTPDISVTIARIALGGVIFAHGAQKILGIWGGHGLQAAMDGFNQWFGIPPFMTALVAIAEFFGAIALVIGLFSRFMAASIILVMLGAIYFVVNGHFFMNWYNQPQYGEGFEFHILAITLGIIVVIKGSGKYAIDNLIAKKLN